MRLYIQFLKINLVLFNPLKRYLVIPRRQYLKYLSLNKTSLLNVFAIMMFI